MGKASRGKTAVHGVASSSTAAAATTVTHTQVKAHMGPVPAPEVLAGYEEILPGAAERILAMAERQQSSRIALDSKQLQADIDHRDEMARMQKRVHTGSFISDYLGQLFGFVIALACIGCAAYAGIWEDKWVVAGLFLSLPVAGIIQAVRGMKSKDNQKK